MDRKGANIGLGWLIGLIIALVLLGAALYFQSNMRESAEKTTESLTGCGQGKFFYGECKFRCDEDKYNALPGLCGDDQYCCVPKEGVKLPASSEAFGEFVTSLEECGDSGECSSATSRLKDQIITDNTRVEFSREGDLQIVRHLEEGQEIAAAESSVKVSSCVQDSEDASGFSVESEGENVVWEQEGRKFESFSRISEELVCANFEG